MHKSVILDSRAEKEIGKFPKSVRIKLWAYIEELQEKGELKELLSGFQKKTQKTPSKELDKAINRLYQYVS